MRPIRREQREQREGILRFQAETFIEASPWLLKPAPSPRFLRFLAETFIEASTTYWCSAVNALIFLPNLEGLSLRTHALSETGVYYEIFSLSGETCIKAQRGRTNGEHRRWLFPYSFVGTFIEAKALHDAVETSRDISSLPMWRGFH